MIAERYPHDYDAIIIGYAASNETGIGAIQFPWLAHSSMFENGTLIFSPEDIISLHSGAVAACDANDGVVDGIVDPTYECSFDPVAILCTDKKTTNCLSSMIKVEAARKMYSYPSNSKDAKLIDSRYVPGSELEWATWATVRTKAVPMILLLTYIRYMAGNSHSPLHEMPPFNKIFHSTGPSKTTIGKLFHTWSATWKTSTA